MSYQEYLDLLDYLMSFQIDIQNKLNNKVSVAMKECTVNKFMFENNSDIDNYGAKVLSNLKDMIDGVLYAIHHHEIIEKNTKYSYLIQNDKFLLYKAEKVINNTFMITNMAKVKYSKTQHDFLKQFIYETYFKQLG